MFPKGGEVELEFGWYRTEYSRTVRVACPTTGTHDLKR